jgi:DmsE family decaheme c-type cytochrome
MGRSDRVALSRGLKGRPAGVGGRGLKIAKTQIASLLAGLACLVVFGSSGAVRAQNAAMPDAAYAALRDYAQQIGSDEVQPSTGGHSNDHTAFAALSDFAQKLPDYHPVAAPSRQIKIADADSLFDALQQFLQRQNGAAPTEQPKPVAPPLVRPEEPVIAATIVGSNICLGCHTAQAEPFTYTLMGRLQKQGKLQCETCHGPGSAHVRAVGCAVCHGDGGITTRPGIPSLVGQDPQYLIVAMKDYIAGERKNALMKALLSGLSEAELNNIAFYYARQSPARAQTPLVGNPSSGKAASASCAACHGEQGVSVSPAFPSLAGQDAQYLADAIRAYRSGSRSKVVACAACHGERGISKRPGTPSLVGLDPQYLVAAMKAYVAGQRKNAVMKALLSGAGDAELNNMALYYAQQIPSRAPTPSVGDVSAGKTASAACAGCHGEQGVSANPAWPSLAGQDAQYLADALAAYKDGSRTDATMQGMVASLDQQTIENLASYYASLHPEQPSSAKNTPAKPAPVVVANRLLASLDQRTIDNVASYYASLSPAQPEIAKNAPARPVPALVTRAAPVDGLSPGGIISYRPNDPGRTAEQNNAICLTCHERGQRTYWEGSVHQERGVACTNCHTIMAAVSTQGQLKTAFQPDTCFQCHKDRRAQMFRSAHMPMREGKIVCSDCHNPHGSATEGLLWTNSINDTCYKCHAEKRGPFLFEHEPVRENCLNCHDPHGSINEASLKMSRPRLCFECHTIGPHGNLGTAGPFSDLTMSRACNNCHTMIHGSNSPAGGALQR